MSKGQVVAVEPGVDDVNTLSPPVVVTPVYTCGAGVAVGGFIPGAEVTLHVTEAATGTVTSFAARSSELDTVVNFALPRTLEAMDRLVATQEFAGVLSDKSTEAIVEDYPRPDLPIPLFDADEVYACADSVSVRATNGSTITVSQTRAGTVASVTGAPGNGWLLADGVAYPAPGSVPWLVGDRFTAEARLECVSQGQLRSWVSPKATLDAVSPPAVLQTPSFEPAQAYDGQRILGVRTVTYGAFSWLARNTPGLNLGRTRAAPDGWGANFDVLPSPLGRTILTGEEFSASPALSCPSSPPGNIVTTPPVRPCSQMPAPEVAAPRAGETRVVVLRALPGARIRVFDASGNEIGDGQGPLLGLRRVLVTGDVLRVTQTAGTCSSHFAFSIPVRSKE